MTTELTAKRRCTATRKDGSPCQAWASRTTGLCPLHSENKHQIQVKGGLSKTKAHMLETRMNPKLKDVVELLATSARQVHSGEISPAAGSSLAAIATALVRAVESAELSLRLSILEIQLRGDQQDEY
jgi:hypothetical protein